MSRYFEFDAHPDRQDRVDERRAQWTTELPDIDTRGMAILGRVRWITLTVRPLIESLFKAYGLDSGEADVLFTLLRSGPPYRLRPTELFRSLMVSSGGMTDRLNRLTKAGLIRRAVIDGDGRSLPVELTGKGICCAKDAFLKDMEMEATMLEGLSDEEQDQLVQLLRKLAISLESTPTSD